jgi:hypothetical protein
MQGARGRLDVMEMGNGVESRRPTWEHGSKRALATCHVTTRLPQVERLLLPASLELPARHEATMLGASREMMPQVISTR